MKTLPPIPPNCGRLSKDSEGRVFWTAPGKQVVICLNSPHPDHAISPAWREIIAADAEVSFRKEADKYLAQGREETNDAVCRQYGKYADGALCDAEAWRSWAEPETEEAK